MSHLQWKITNFVKFTTFKTTNPQRFKHFMVNIRRDETAQKPAKYVSGRYRRHSEAEKAYNKLQGLFCLYKPPDFPINRIQPLIVRELVKGLNSMPYYYGEKFLTDVKTLPENDERSLTQKEIMLTNSQQSNLGQSYYKKAGGDVVEYTEEYLLDKASEMSIPNNRSHVSSSVYIPPIDFKNPSQSRLVKGDWYKAKTLNVEVINERLSDDASGLILMSVGEEAQAIKETVERMLFLKVYHVSGTLGWTTIDNSVKTNKKSRHKWEHVDKARLDQTCTLAQSKHRVRMMDFAGVMQNSREAYELAKHGLVKPVDDTSPPLLYGVKCIKFDPPNFTLEIHCINEDHIYLKNFIMKVGVSVGSSAYCTKIRRIRIGPFDLDKSLIYDDWTLSNIIGNIKLCYPDIMKNK